MDDDRVWAFEKSLWTGDAQHYRDLIDEACVMVLPLFFRKRELGASAAASGAMIATSVGYVVVASRVDKTAAATAVPFVAWLGFATLLAERIWQRNAV